MEINTVVFFTLWRFLKHEVYETPVDAGILENRRRILTETMKENVLCRRTFNMLRGEVRHILIYTGKEIYL